MFDQLVGEPVGFGPIDAIAGGGGQSDAGGDGFLGFSSEAFQFADAVRLAGSAQLVERGDCQFAMQDGRFFGAQARDAHQLQNAGGDLRFQLVQQRDAAGVDQRNDLVGQVAADAFDFGQFGRRVRGHASQRLGPLPHRPGSAAIGSHAKRVGRLEFQEIGDQVQRVGNLGVVHPAMIKAGRQASIGGPARGASPRSRRAKKDPPPCIVRNRVGRLWVPVHGHGSVT